LNSLLLITNGFDAATAGRVASALGALPRGSAAVQLRAKDLSGRDLLAAARALVAVTTAHGAPLYVNDRVDVALIAGAQGVHLPARGLPPKPARRVVTRTGDRPFTVGVSTHSLEDAVMAARDGADYVVFGPIWATPGKGAPVGVEALRTVVASVSIPVYALGGVTADNAVHCRAAGARLACIGAVLGASDPAAGARRLAAVLA
jgi:thiamine-phosphate pyrophosphorylase